MSDEFRFACCCAEAAAKVFLFEGTTWGDLLALAMGWPESCPAAILPFMRSST